MTIYVISDPSISGRTKRALRLALEQCNPYDIAIASDNPAILLFITKTLSLWRSPDNSYSECYPLYCTIQDVTLAQNPVVIMCDPVGYDLIDKISQTKTVILANNIEETVKGAVVLQYNPLPKISVSQQTIKHEFQSITARELLLLLDKKYTGFYASRTLNVIKPRSPRDKLALYNYLPSILGALSRLLPEDPTVECLMAHFSVLVDQDVSYIITAQFRTMAEFLIKIHNERNVYNAQCNGKIGNITILDDLHHIIRSNEIIRIEISSHSKYLPAPVRNAALLNACIAEAQRAIVVNYDGRSIREYEFDAEYIEAFGLKVIETLQTISHRGIEIDMYAI